MSTTQSPKLTIFRGFDSPGKFVWSPYVSKLEARLRFDSVSYAVAGGSPRSAPKGKIPYVEIPFGDTAKVESLGDSALIAAALVQRGELRDLNARLSPAERAYDLALRALLEDKLSFYHSWERWTQNYYTMREHVLWPVPWPLRAVVGLIIYRNTVATLHGQGTGRFSAEEIAGFRREIWESFADLVSASRSKALATAAEPAGNHEPFWVLGGPEPTEVDATLFGFVSSTLLSTAGPASQADVKSFPVLVEYARRIQDRYFPDYEELPA
ncbi:hypothetical protein F4777DRAFT_576127 [Nemania sp. FL0916]|nr:hypothetical protein F4777DRAFT_576127 [Nemania sp. FL0916]